MTILATRSSKLNPNLKSIYIHNLCPIPRSSELSLERKKKYATKLRFLLKVYYLYVQDKLCAVETDEEIVLRIRVGSCDDVKIYRRRSELKIRKDRGIIPFTKSIFI